MSANKTWDIKKISNVRRCVWKPANLLVLCLVLEFCCGQLPPPPPGGGPPGGAPPGGGPPPGGGNPPPGGGPPPQGAGGVSSGSVSATGCTSGVTTCAMDGASNFVARSLTYSNGKFTGTIKTNLCPNTPHDTPSTTPSCVEQTFPTTTAGPTAAGLLGRIGMTLSGGVNIYGPFEAGFTLGQACNNNKGQCDGGLDVDSCERQLRFQCGADFRAQMMMDSCGGHAMPYHFHVRLACEYAELANASHSPLVGVMLDGVGLYGQWEGSGAQPVLDACNGHVGPVPADARYGVAAASVYHYHVTSRPPFTVGCFGPVGSLAECKALYPQCGDAYAQVQNESGAASRYDLFCPCFQHMGACNWEDFPALCASRAAAGSAPAGQQLSPTAGPAPPSGSSTPPPGNPALDSSCDYSQTCSPLQCPKVPNPPCTTERSTIDVAASAAAIPCNAQCTQSTDPICGQLGTVLKGTGVKLAYCTDRFIVIHSDNGLNHVEGLANIPRPPGGGGVGSYETQCVTRSKEVQYLSFKVPLATQELPTASPSNNIASFPSTTPPSFLFSSQSGQNISLPSSGPIAVTITGVPVFPAYNDHGQRTWEACEIDHCNAHAGKGFDYHYHGDPFGRWCMYSERDYDAAGGPASHPPLIGWSLDGFRIHGRHLNTAAPGFDVALDECGGHSHGGNGYHYHAQVIAATKSGGGGVMADGAYTAYTAGPHKCWKGDISKIPGFWNGKEAAYGSGRMGPSNLAQRPDYNLLRPCCGGTSFSSFSAPTTSSTSSFYSAAQQAQGGGSQTSTPAVGTESTSPSTSSGVGYVVKISMQLQMSRGQFDAVAQRKFRESIVAASGLNVAGAADSVVLCITDAARRRSLLSGGILVSAEVPVQSTAQGSQVMVALTEAAINTQLKSAGLPTAVLVSPPSLAPRTLTLAAAAATSTPRPEQFSSASLSGAWRCRGCSLRLVTVVLAIYSMIPWQRD